MQRFVIQDSRFNRLMGLWAHGLISLSAYQPISLLCILCLVSCIFWIGCGNCNVQLLGPSAKQPGKTDASAISAPEWFLNIPTDPNYLYSATTATSEELQSAINEAKHEARVDIASQLETRVSGLFKLVREEVGTEQDAELRAMETAVSKEVTSEVVKGTKALKQDVREEEGLYRAFVLMRMPLETFMAKIRGNEDAYALFRTTRAFRELDEGVWKYSEVGQSSLDDAARKAADSLVSADIDPEIRNIVVVGVTRSEVKDKNARNALREAIINSSANRFNIIAEPEGRGIILDELDWLGSGFVDSDQARKIGEALGADGLVFGEIEDGGRCTQRLHLVMSEVKSMKYPWEKSLTGYPNRAKLSAVGWSFVPGCGPLYNFNTAKAIILGGLEIIGIGAAVILHLDYSEAQDSYMKATKITDIEKYRDERDALYTRRNLVSIAPAAIFLYNVLDAYLSARKYQEMRFSGY